MSAIPTATTCAFSGRLSRDPPCQEPDVCVELTTPYYANGGWRDSHACTTSVLHGFLGGAYTGGDSRPCVRRGRIRVSWRSYDCRKRARALPGVESQGRGTSARGGSESVSGRGTPTQSCGAIRTAGKGRSCRLPGVGEGADVLAAARSSSPHDHGEDR